MRNVRIALAAAAVIALALAASTQARVGAAPADLAGARARIAAVKGVPPFVAPGAAFDARKARGKTIFNIPVASYLPFVVDVGKEMKRIAGAHGIGFVDYPNQGQPSQWVAGIDQAISRHADLIVLNTGVDPRLVGPQLAEAKKAGIPVLVTHMWPAGYRVPRGVTAQVPAPFADAGRLLADGAISETGGDADVLMLLDNEYDASRLMQKTAAAEMAKRCPSCKLTFASVNVADWATKIQSTVQTALVRDPGIDFVMPIFDAMQQFTIAGITAAGATGRVKTGSYNGDPAVLKLIGSASTARFTIGESAQQLAYVNMDQALRILSGVKPVVVKSTPIRFFDSSNVAETGNPPDWSVGYGNAYPAAYEKLWRG
jgi:ribose transport system substrate-binding protein